MNGAELETYQGRNPRPDNFDTFWDEGLAEMRAVDPQIELSTQFAAYNKIEADKSLAIFPDFGHEALPGHGDQIFQFIILADKTPSLQGGDVVSQPPLSLDFRG